MKRTKIVLQQRNRLQRRPKSKRTCRAGISATSLLVQWILKRRGDPIPHLMRTSPTGKMSKLMGCIVKGSAKKSESAESKGGLGLNNIMYDVPKWGPSSRVIDCINHIRSIIFTHHTRKMQLLSKQETLLYGKDFH